MQKAVFLTTRLNCKTLLKSYLRWALCGSRQEFYRKCNVMLLLFFISVFKKLVSACSCLCLSVLASIRSYKLWSTDSSLTHISLVSFLWDICKQNSPRCDAAFCGVPSGAILFAFMNFIEKYLHFDCTRLR